MANICKFGLYAKGNKANIERFTDIYETDYLSDTQHFYKLFEIDYNRAKPAGNGKYIKFFYGDCANSAFACFRKDGYKTMPRYSDGACLEDLSVELNLTFEYFGEEPLEGFAEHCIIKNGEVVLDETAPYKEIFVRVEDSDEDIRSILSLYHKELEKEGLGNLSVEDFRDYLEDCEGSCYNGEILCLGGFKRWSPTI